MTIEGKKYERILSILKKSKPALTNPEEVEAGVIDEILKSRNSRNGGLNLFNYLFGWTYIVWIRSSLIAVSLFFVGLFIYQQSLILKRINLLENQTLFSGNQFVSTNSSELEGRMMLNRLFIRNLNKGEDPISKKQMERLLNSYNELDHKYKDLILLIEDDPELRQMLEKKLSEKNRRKFNL